MHVFTKNKDGKTKIFHFSDSNVVFYICVEPGKVVPGYDDQVDQEQVAELTEDLQDLLELLFATLNHK